MRYKVLSEILPILDNLDIEVDYCVTYVQRDNELKIQIGQRLFFSFYLDHEDLSGALNEFIQTLVDRKYIKRIPTRLDDLL
jgi:hypothetical protein